MAAEYNFVVGDGASDVVKEFVTAFEPFCVKSAEGTQLRREAFSATDGNGSGKISLAEMETFIMATLSKAYPEDDKGDVMFALFRPCYRHAFKNAKDVISGSGGDGDYVSFPEFRLFAVYLRIYAAMFDIFTSIDGGAEGRDANDDCRISLPEFLKSMSALEDRSFIALQNLQSEDDAKDLFHKIDENEGGMILFGEWSTYLKQEEVTNDTPLGRLLNMKITQTQHKSPRKQQNIKNPLPVTPSPQQPQKKVIKVSGVYSPGKSNSAELLQFIETFHSLAEKTTHGLELRKKAFKSCDGNGSMKISLAEVDGYIQSSLKKKCGNDKGTVLYKSYRPSYLIAFNAAKPIARNTESADNDFVDFAEFRVLHAYLCIYAGALDLFMKIDGGGGGVDENDDRRIEKSEWMKHYKNIVSCDFVALRNIATDATAESVFGNMDADGKGMVLLSEFCNYLKSCEVKAQTGLGNLLSGKLTARKIKK